MTTDCSVGTVCALRLCDDTPPAATAAPLPAAGLPGARMLRGVVCVCVPSFGVDTDGLTNTTKLEVPTAWCCLQQLNMGHSTSRH